MVVTRKKPIAARTTPQKVMNTPKVFIVLESREGFKSHPVVEARVQAKYGDSSVYKVSFEVDGQVQSTLRAEHRIFDTYQKGFIARTELYTRYGYQN